MIIMTKQTAEKKYGKQWQDEMRDCLFDPQPTAKGLVAFKNGCSSVPKSPVIENKKFGLGDLVAKVANPIAKTINKVAGTNLSSDNEGCGCAKRKKALNNMIPNLNPFS